VDDDDRISRSLALLLDAAVEPGSGSPPDVTRVSVVLFPTNLFSGNIEQML
jgi:hypothetical protein